MDHTSTTSADLHAHHLEQFRALFPHFVKDGEIDFDALQAFLKQDGTLAGPEKYGLSWAGKSNAFNLIRRPASGTLTPNLKESKSWDTTQNLFIEGDNLEVLKLLQKHYRNSIKMIYIDPPYNTGKDFIYSDNFTESVSDYYERTGQRAGGVKLTSNPESNGRYHSDWLTMMYPRLFLGKNLLREDGVIFVSIDDNEVHNLRLIMDEIFGEENFVCTFMWKRKKEISNDAKNISTQGEYILCYTKRNGTSLKLETLSEEYIQTSYNEPNKHFPLGKWRPVPITISKGLKGGGYEYEIVTPKNTKHKRIWAYPEESFKRLLDEKRIYFGVKEDGIPQRIIYDFENTGKPISNYWDNLTSNKEGKKEILELFKENFFDTPKPTILINKLIKISSENNDLILDFFAGSGTTAHAVMNLNAEDGGNRRWISVQLPELTDDASEAKKAGFNTIADISRERIRRAGDKIDKGDIGFKAFTLSPSNYRRWRDIPAEDTNALTAQTNLFNQKPLVDGYNEQSVVYELLVKEGFGLNTSVTQKLFGSLTVWHVTDGERRMIVSFAPTVRKEQIEALGLSEHNTFVCFDSALDDTTKANVGRSLKIKVM